MGKKTKRQEELEVVTKVEDQEEPEEKKKAKKSRVSTKEKEVVRTEEEQENNSNDTPSKIKEEKNNMINTDSFAAYKKMMGKVNPTRAERSRRDNQRKMQAFVKELREKGTDEVTIKKLKRKLKNKNFDVDKAINSKGNGSGSDFIDREIECKDCGEMFLFSSKEQAFYEKKGFSDMVRCKSCIQSKRERMAVFDKKGVASVDEMSNR